MALTKEELLARRAKREEAQKVEAEARELEELQLEDDLCDKHGVRGRDFEIVNTDVGVFAVKRADFVVAKNFNESKDQGIEAITRFVLPCLLTDKTMFTATIQQHPGVASRCAIALLAMFEANALARVGKF